MNNGTKRNSDTESETPVQKLSRASTDSAFERMELDLEETAPNSSSDNKNGNATSDESGVLSGTLHQSGINDTSDDESVYSKKSKKIVKLRQPLRIISVDLEKVDRAIDKRDNAKKGKAKTNVDRIEFIMHLYYSKPKKDVSYTDTGYKKIEYKGQFNETNKFKLMVWSRTTVEQHEETGSDITVVHIVRFLYRDDPRQEIFALPSGSGRYIVMKWANIDFPLSIASRILDPNSVTEKEVKNLFDNRFLSKFKMLKGERLTETTEFHLSFAPQVYTKFHANIKNVDLKKFLRPSEQVKVVKMQVQQDSILFPVGVKDMNKYSDLCEKISSIHHDSDLVRSREFDGYLSRVSTERQTDLDNLLLAEVIRIFSPISRNSAEEADPLGKLKHFLITHKNSAEYFKANEFHIFCKNQKLQKTLHEAPKLVDIREIVEKIYASKGMEDIINSIKISISKEGNKSRSSKKGLEKTEKFFNCLEGIFYDDITQQDFWRVGGVWYQVRIKYIFEIYKEYLKVLKTSLDDKSLLNHTWPLKADRQLPDEDNVNKKKFRLELQKYKQSRFDLESKFNKSFENEPYFINCDNGPAPYGSEICDLFQYIPPHHRDPNDNSTINLHFVKKAFGADGYRSAICQILAIAYNLHNAIKSQTHDKDNTARKLFDFIQETRGKSCLIPHYTSYEEFRKELRHATIVLSILFETGERELDKDLNIAIKYDFRDIEEKIDVEFRKKLEVQLELHMINNGYVESDKEFTAKWYEACKDNLGLPGKTDSNLPKIKLIQIMKSKYYRTVDAFSTKQLIVHMSGVMNTLGFGFKICQIEGDEDELLNKKM